MCQALFWGSVPCPLNLALISWESWMSICAEAGKVSPGGWAVGMGPGGCGGDPPVAQLEAGTCAGLDKEPGSRGRAAGGCTEVLPKPVAVWSLGSGGQELAAPVADMGVGGGGRRAGGQQAAGMHSHVRAGPSGAMLPGSPAGPRARPQVRGPGQVRETPRCPSSSSVRRESVRSTCSSPA